MSFLRRNIALYFAGKPKNFAGLKIIIEFSTLNIISKTCLKKHHSYQTIE